MVILHRYLLTQFLKNLGLFLCVCVLLFTVIDFFDRIDNIAGEGATLGSTVMYFLYKIPITIHLMLPISILVSTIFTIGMLSKNYEVTAIRSAGVTLFKFARPVLLAGFLLSFVSFGFSEVVVPYCTRKSKEIYNIDIKKKNLRGNYSQENFWWRDKEKFYSIDTFDSRTDTLSGITILELNQSFNIIHRTDAQSASWIDSNLGWSMRSVDDYHFLPNGEMVREHFRFLPLPIDQEPRFFYDMDLETESMGYFALRKYIKKLRSDGISVEGYIVDLRSKMAFPFVNFICILGALPFALKTGRSGGMALNFLAGVTIGFTYYFVNSLSISLGRAELLDPTIAAWSANMLLGFVGLILNWGAEAP